MTRLATTLGLFPLPDGAKAELTAQKGKQRDDMIDGTEGSTVGSIYEEVRTELIELQRSAGLDRIGEGQARWDDMLAHPLAVHDAVETGGLLRYYDNNNFYREVRVTGDLAADGDVAAELASLAEAVDETDRHGIFPGPYSLAQLATDGHYGDESDFQAAIGEFVASELAAFPDCETVTLLEPSLATNPDTAGEPAFKAIETAVTAVDASDVIVQSYWGNPSPDGYAALRELECGIGFDLVTDTPGAEALIDAHGAPETLALGVIDGQNTRMEDAEEVASLVAAFESAAEPERTYLTPNTELFYLPTNHVQEKLEVLATAADPTEVSQ